jgi:putative transposase
VSAKYSFIGAEKANYPVTKMCGWLSVSRSGSHGWSSREETAAEERRGQLRLLISKAFDDSHGTYGHRRIWAQLARWGVAAGLELVRRLMRELGLAACQPRPWRATTARDGRVHTIPDLVQRDFTAPAPGQKLVGDITYIHTWEGWLFLATVLDCCTKEVIGWAMASHMQTGLISAAIDMAAVSISFADGAVFHSDRGSQYTSAEFASKLKGHGITQSLGRTGTCYDNAMAESFFGALKNEWLHRMVFATRAKARREVVKYIEGFYNRRRLHSAIGYQTPYEARIAYLNEQPAA